MEQSHSSASQEIKSDSWNMTIPFRVQKNPLLVFALKLMKRSHAPQPCVFNILSRVLVGIDGVLDW
jgi:hypothetical protein